MKKFILSLLGVLLLLVSFGQTVQVVTLDGSKSFDPDGSITAFRWHQIGTTPIKCIFADSTAAITTVVPANGVQWAVGVYQFALTVSDNLGLVSSDTMKVTVSPNPDKPPTVNAGNDMTSQLPGGSTVTLTAIASDPDGTVNAYLWNEVSGPNQAIGTNLNTPTATFSGLIIGTYFFRCKVTDNLGAQAVDTVKITVIAANQVPKADAGADKTITLPVNSVAIGGKDSPDGSQVRWVKVSGPAGDLIKDPAASLTQVSNLSRGVFTYQKTVRTPDGQSATDLVNVTVKKKCSWIDQIFGGCK